MIKNTVIILLGFSVVYTILELFAYFTNKFFGLDLKRSLVAYDKKLHFGAGSLIFILGYILFSMQIGLLLAIATGILKEVHDYFKPDKHTACIWDIVYTVLGALAVLILFSIIF